MALPEPVPEDRALLRWQNKLLPFMSGGLAALGVIFFAATLWHYTQLQPHFKAPAMELREELQRLDRPGAPAASPEYKDWYARALLEEMALKRRYQQNSIGMQSRIWTRLMGFLTGMVLVFSGCIFILGKLREGVDVSGDIQGAKWALATSSPGIVLALAGTVLIGLAIYVPSTVESSDAVVYLPVQARVVPAVPGAAPQPMTPPALPAAADGAALPPELEAAMREEAAKAACRAANCEEKTP